MSAPPIIDFEEMDKMASPYKSIQEEIEFSLAGHWVGVKITMEELRK